MAYARGWHSTDSMFSTVSKMRHSFFACLMYQVLQIVQVNRTGELEHVTVRWGKIIMEKACHNYNSRLEIINLSIDSSY